MSICEVRIPTYKRPRLLKRAIESLLGQTYKNWIGIIMDDSPQEEARDIVNCCGDRRLIYGPNRTRLGAAANLDRAFKSKSLVGGSYAFVLEDDNFLLPDFINANIKSLAQNNVAILLRNQHMHVEKDGKSVPTGNTTRGDWFFRKSYEPSEMRPYLFFHTGISNGGLFWDTKRIISNLQVGPEVKDSSFQEMFRCVQTEERIYFAEEPLSVFTYFTKRDNTKVLTKKETRLFNRAQQSIYMYLLRRYGYMLVERATRIADEKGFRLRLERCLADAFYTAYNFKCIKKREFMRILAKSVLRLILYEDPFKGYYRNLR